MRPHSLTHSLLCPFAQTRARASLSLTIIFLPLLVAGRSVAVGRRYTRGRRSTERGGRTAGRRSQGAASHCRRERGRGGRGGSSGKEGAFRNFQGLALSPARPLALSRSAFVISSSLTVPSSSSPLVFPPSASVLCRQLQPPPLLRITPSSTRRRRQRRRRRTTLAEVGRLRGSAGGVPLFPLCLCVSLGSPCCLATDHRGDGKLLPSSLSVVAPALTAWLYSSSLPSSLLAKQRWRRRPRPRPVGAERQSCIILSARL